MREIPRQFYLGDDGLDHAIGVLKDIVVPEADHTIAVGFDQPGTVFVARAIGMLPSVQLDHEFEAAAGKVDDRVPDSELAGELHPQLPTAQLPPQALLRIRGIRAQLASNRG